MMGDILQSVEPHFACRCGGRPRSHKALILEHATLTTCVCKAKQKHNSSSCAFALLTHLTNPQVTSYHLLLVLPLALLREQYEEVQLLQS